MFITAEKGRVASAKGEGEKENECTTEDRVDALVSDRDWPITDPWIVA